jgi:hypothetical protein
MDLKILDLEPRDSRNAIVKGRYSKVTRIKPSALKAAIQALSKGQHIVEMSNNGSQHSAHGKIIDIVEKSRICKFKSERKPLRPSGPPPKKSRKKYMRHETAGA